MINLPHYDYLASLTPVTAYLEIGVQEGRSLEAVVVANPTLQHVTVCDTWGPVDGGTNRGSHAHIEALLARLRPGLDVTYLDGESQRLIPGVTRRYDLIHVDGAHNANAAATDLANVTPLATGRIVVHDVFFPAVWEACTEWLRRNASRFEAATINAEGTGSLTVTVGRG